MEITVENVYEYVVKQGPVTRNAIADYVLSDCDHRTDKSLSSARDRVSVVLRTLKAAGRLTQTGNTRAAVYTATLPLVRYAAAE